MPWPFFKWVGYALEELFDLKQQRRMRILAKGLRLNYLYFGPMFLLLACLHSWSVILAGKQADSLPWVFVGHAVVQAGFEAVILAYVAAFLHARKARILEGVFIIFTVIVCIVHVIDFHLVRLMDISIWYTLDFVLDESWRNFLELLIASTLPFTKIFFSMIGLCLGSIAAIWLFTRSQRIVLRKKRWEKLFRNPTRVLASGLFVLGVCELAIKNKVDPSDYERYTKALPWKRGLFEPHQRPEVDVSLKPGISPQDMDNRLAAQCREVTARPNIFLFVVETLREDFLNESSAPHLVQFRNTVPLKGYSNSNATQISWFSIFYSQSPLYFGDFHRSGWKEGSPVLAQFKRAGYKLHLYSGSRLSYYGMNELIFGEQYKLVDDVYLDFPARDRAAWQCDQAMVKHLCDDIHKFKEEDGHLFVIFIESTHFGYSLPVSQETFFTPCASDINFVKAACFQDGLEEIKNRYLNAIHYVDGLIGQFTTALKQEDRFEDSLIVITADHGEEFFEQGNLFHASGLSLQQITVPIYFHIGKQIPESSVVSHVDIMPTLLHLTMGQEIGREIFYGESVLHEGRKTSAMSGRYNASRSPHEFILQNEMATLHARFSNPYCPARSANIQVIAFKQQGQPSQETSIETMTEAFGKSFTDLFVRTNHDLHK
ncbi:MAG: sulfatase-like hydrolase/transferase [Simkania sp.]|nr:sulfatase-like hydrolase/transferase [Simkania sp.]